MSDHQGQTNDFINQLVVKAIEKKKKNEETLANKLKPRLEHVLFSQFDVLDTIESKNKKTTLYRLAKKDEPEKQICCKVLNSEQSDVINDMFLTEATHLEIAQHPSIAEFIKLGKEFEQPYFMYKWVDGESVSKKLSRYKYKNFRHDHIAWLIYQLAGALEYIHTQGICHLDIKPSNIIICEDDSIKIIDFGASKDMNDVSTYSEVSLAYASPLFIKSGKAIPQDDVYSMALLTCCLFTGYSDNNDWKIVLKQRKRPSGMPKSVWNLLRLVVENPRNHGLTPISFAQALAYIDTKAIQSNHNAPLFTQLKNADLVLRKNDKYDFVQIGRFKYLETVLVVSVFILMATFLFTKTPLFQTQNTDIALVQNSTVIASPQVAQSSENEQWSAKQSAESRLSDSQLFSQYRNVTSVQNSQLGTWYQQEEDKLQQQRLSQITQFSELKEMHKDTVYIRDILARNNALSPLIDKRLARLITTVNSLKLEHQKYNYSSMLEGNVLAKNILMGQSENVQEYMKNAWVKSQAESYFYAKILPNDVLKEILILVDNQAESHFYSNAISDLDKAIKVYGNSVELIDKRSELIVKRSEYILFGTVTGENVFQSEKLTLALKELDKIEPKRFKEVAKLLKKMSQDSLNKSFKKNIPTDGALLIEKALNKYQNKVTI
ncbi:serine/threonine protein kinase [Aliivibrio wodanis]|uniref:serine/threonine protein kinase n=1 Tax=Aliivibrio wodanis TaxID=80852 RepID=UPI00406BE703